MARDYFQGTIINVHLGEPPKEIKGHEQGYERPCIVIKSFSWLELAIVVPCTSKEPFRNIYTTVKLVKGAGGLKKDSYVLCHQIRTISYDRIINEIGIIDKIDFLKIHAVLVDMLEI